MIVIVNIFYLLLIAHVSADDLKVAIGTSPISPLRGENVTNNMRKLREDLKVAIGTSTTSPLRGENVTNNMRKLREDLKVAIGKSPISALRGQDVSIPCKITNIDDKKPIIVQWKKTLWIGTEKVVLGYEGGQMTAHRSRSYMDVEKILDGNAKLHLRNVQISDEGEYTCSVINTPRKASSKTDLQVSVPPQVKVTHVKKRKRKEVLMTCEVTKFYPQSITIRWVRFNKNSPGYVNLEDVPCTTYPFVNRDGTVDITSHLKLDTLRVDYGSSYGCVVSHRSIQHEFVSNGTIPERETEEQIHSFVNASVIVWFVVSTAMWAIKKWYSKASSQSGYTGEDTTRSSLAPLDRSSALTGLKTRPPTDVGHDRKIVMTGMVANLKTGTLQAGYSKASCQSGYTEEATTVISPAPLDQSSTSTGLNPCPPTDYGHDRNVVMTGMVANMKTGTLRADGVGDGNCDEDCRPFYFSFLPSVAPTLSDITGDNELIHMCRTTLTCQVNGYRPQDITISVGLRRPGQQERTIITSKFSNKHRFRPQTLVDGATNKEKVSFDISKQSFDLNRCTCFLSIIPSYDEDNGAELSVHVTHQALKSPISVHRILKVAGVPPRLSDIIAPEFQTPNENVTLFCVINDLKPAPVFIKWLKRDMNMQVTEVISWTPETLHQHNEKYSHHIKEDKRVSSHSCISSLTFKPTVNKDDGVTYICRTFHPVTQTEAEKEVAMRLTAFPQLDEIQKKQEDIYVGEELNLSCRIHSFYPADITVTWYVVDSLLPSECSEPIQEPSTGLYYVTTNVSYTPTTLDWKKFRCEVHQGTAEPRHITWTLKDFSEMTRVQSWEGSISDDETLVDIEGAVNFEC